MIFFTVLEVEWRRRRWVENEVCIEKLLETLASCVADGGSQQCFNLMGQRERRGGKF